MNKQENLFKPVGRCGTLEPNLDPFSHQASRGKANSALALAKHKAAGFHILQKDKIKAYLRKYPESTLDEISWGTGIVQKGVITARFDDLRKDGWDLLNNHGKWSVRKRENR